MLRLFFVCTLIMNTSAIFAQDPHFSQFFASPLTLNPAFTGKFDGTVRVAGNYRNQWPTINRAFQTTTASVDFGLLRNKLAFGDTWGVGLMGFSDQSANGAVKFNYASISTAYHKALDEDGYQQIGAGFQVTFANMMVNTTQLKFEDQLTSSGFTGVTNEVFRNNNLKGNYVDVNAGVLYTGSTSDRNNYYAGISVYHVNRPRQRFTGAYYLMEPRWTFHGGGFFPLGEDISFHTSGIFSQQGGANELVVGGALQYNLSESEAEKPVSFYAGSWIRMKDAIIPYIGLEFNDFRLGVTYDVNTSELKAASESRGGIEISLIYIRRPSGSSGIPCPKF